MSLLPLGFSKSVLGAPPPRLNCTFLPSFVNTAVSQR